VTRYNFQYQDAIGISLLLSPEWNYEAVLCEEGDDFLALNKAGEWHAIQVKTSTGERRWKLNDEPVVQSIRNFVRLHTTKREGGAIAAFYFVSNLPADDLPSKASMSPTLMTKSCREGSSLTKLEAPFRESLNELAEKISCSSATLFAVLSRTKFALGLDRRTYHEQLYRQLSARRELLPGQVIASWLDKLFAHFAEVSASVGRRYETRPRNARVSREILDHTLADILRSPSTAVTILTRDLQQSRRFDGSVANFLSHYMGTEERPRLLAGRTDELAMLDRWLASSETPYCLLTANAALGKSALVVEWSRRGAAWTDTDLIFYPISHRFNTNGAAQVFHSLYSKLSIVLGRHGADAEQPSFSDWRNDFSGLLRDVRHHPRRVVLVLDGLDEALDWQAGPDLFPVDPPPNLRVLVTARPLAGDSATRNWRTRLGWTRRGLAKSMEIDKLDQRAVEAVVTTVLPNLPQENQRRLAAAFYRVTTGDPLLLQFYLEAAGDAIASGESSADVLHSLSRAGEGYDAFIDRLFGGGREGRIGLKEHESFFSTLACSLGPIEADDLRCLDVLVPDLDALDLGLRRLIVGSHREGLSLCHPKLAEFFKSRAGSQRCKEIEDRLLAWCKQVVASLKSGDLTPDAVPRYVLRHGGAHLKKTHDIEGSISLADPKWAEAWLAAEIAYDGFLIDVRRAWDRLISALEEQNSPAIAQLLRLALIVARCRLPAISPELFQALIREGLWTVVKAFDYACAHRRDEFFEYLGELLSEERVVESLQLILGSYGTSDGAAPQTARIAAPLLRRLIPEERSEYLKRFMEKTSEVRLEPECTLAHAYFLELLDGEERNAVLERIRGFMESGRFLPFFFEEILPILAKVCGRDSELFARTIRRGVIYALDLRDNVTPEEVESQVDVLLEFRIVPSRMLETYGGLLQWLPESDWKLCVDTARRLIDASPDSLQKEDRIRLYEAALPSAPATEKGKLVMECKRLLEGKLEHHHRERLLKALGKSDSSSLRECAEELAELAITHNHRVAALDAFHLGNSFLPLELAGRLIKTVKAAPKFSLTREKDLISLLPFLSGDERKEVFGDLVSSQSRSVNPLYGTVARYALGRQIDAEAGRQIANEVRGWHYNSKREFFCEAAWLPIEHDCGAMFSIIDIGFLDKVYPEALGQVFRRATETERRKFLLNCFQLRHEKFPEMDAIKGDFGLQILTLHENSQTAKYLPARFPHMVSAWLEEAWPILLELLAIATGEGSTDIADSLKAAALYAPSQYRARLREIIVLRLNGAEQERLLGLLDSPVHTLTPHSSDPMERLIEHTSGYSNQASVLEPFQKLKSARSLLSRTRCFRECLDLTVQFRVGLALGAFEVLHECRQQIPLNESRSLLFGWLSTRAEAGWDALMLALARSAVMLGQVADSSELQTIIESISEVEAWFGSDHPRE
jgi:hypothetical protein